MGNTNAFLKSLAHLTIYTTRHSDIRDRLKVTPINGHKDSKKTDKRKKQEWKQSTALCRRHSIT